MGKKLDRGQRSDKSASSAHHEADDGTKSPGSKDEPYVCTGKFQDDFAELCSRANLMSIPSVVNRARRPGTPPPPPEAKPEKGGKEKGKKGAEPVAVQPETEPIPEDGEQPEPPPKTYVVKERFEYFKPTVQVEVDHTDKHEAVTEVYIRGWKVDEVMMNIFKQCWTVMDKLHTVTLWNAGLTEEMLTQLGSFLHTCPNVRSLSLDNNTPAIKAENYHVLVGEESQLLNLNLRHNQITDLGVQNISKALGGYKNPNTRLVSLNLTGNRIGDVGATALADALRLNRTLLSASLAQNKITDVGAKALAQTLKCFPLTHEEVVERRKLKSEKGFGSDGGKSPPPSRRAESKDRPGSHRSSSHLGKEKRDKSSKKKEDKADTKGQTKGKGKDIEKTQAGKKEGNKGTKAAAESTKAAAKGKDKKGGKGQTKGATPLEPEPEASDVLNPLLEAAETINQQLWIPGNRILINLNLQRNNIGAEGVNAFKLAIQYQDTILNESPKTQGTGLMRLIINKNLLSAENGDLYKLSDMMMRRDPFYKPPATPAQTDEDAALLEKSR